MKNYFYILLICLSLFGYKCTSYQNQDIGFVAGEWNVVKVTSYNDRETSLIDVDGTFTINEDGTGFFEVPPLSNTSETETLKCRFVVQTARGIDYSFYLYGVMRLDESGIATEYMCEDGKLHFSIEKQKSSKMILAIEDYEYEYPCGDTDYPLGNGQVWYLEKK